MTTPNTVPADENKLIAERRQKLAAIRARGIAFPASKMPKPCVTRAKSWLPDA